MNPRAHILGIRHHGPGSAASVVAALERVQPAEVLIEGPPEANALIALCTDPGLVPPVALLVHPKKSPGDAAFYPFAEFSPEWVAMRWGVRNGRHVEFIDLPSVGRQREREVPRDDDGDADTRVRTDPLGALAAAAGHSDGEAWWNALVEQGQHGMAVFDAIADAMCAVREPAAVEGGEAPEPDGVEAGREAHMRLALRDSLKRTAEDEAQVAVVCGAYHVPALQLDQPVNADRARVRSVPGRGAKGAACECCWIPWTDDRLASASGYGAGVVSPGWYRHLWRSFADGGALAPEVSRWQAEVAAALRDEGVAASTASVIEAARLTEALAAVRQLPVAGLTEMRDASLAVLCAGNDAPLRLVEQRLVIGTRVGEVPEHLQQPPLLADLARLQRKLRLKPEAIERDVSLDLRSEAGMAKSALLHRLNLLGVPWGELTDAAAGRGTFRELWRLLWEPELSVRLAEAVVHGTTVADAAASFAATQARTMGRCETLAELVNACLLANLPDAMKIAVRRLQQVAVSTTAMTELMGALPPLVEVQRYGTARQVPLAGLALLIDSLVVEIAAGLRYACHQLDDDAATAMRDAVRRVDRAVRLLKEDEAKGDRNEALWLRALGDLCCDDKVSPLVAGQAQRLRFERGVVDAEHTALAVSRRLSRAVPVPAAGAWLEGFVDEAGEIFLLDDALRGTVDAWLGAVDAEAFTELLPMLRRAFATFDPMARKRLLDAVASGSGPAARSAGDDKPTDVAFAAAQPLVWKLLGLPDE